MTNLTTGMLHQVGLPMEMQLAGKVQKLLFPKVLPVCDWCCIGVKNRMAAVLGGDFFDFFLLDDGCQVVLVGDVTGHGLHASLVMSLVYGYLHRSLMDGRAPLSTVADLNAFLRSFAKRSARYDHYFSATLFFALIDPSSLDMRYVNAGHPTGLVRRGQALARLMPTGHPLGYFDQPELEEKTFRLLAGDRLLLYTDGVVDGLNPGGEVFGTRSLEKLLLARQCDHLEFLEELFAAVNDHLEGDAIVDDCTAIVMDL